MQFTQLRTHLEALAPLRLAESWDKVGLHVGDPDADVTRALLCIDLTEAVLEEAIARGAQLIVAYHPPIFQPLASVTPRGAKERLIFRAVRQGLVIYSPHTALDAAAGGVNDWLCEAFGKGARRAIRPAGPADSDCKLVTFVPLEAADALRQALADAGAGRIGHYDLCSFGIVGEGTFRGDPTTNPAVGQAGRFERAEELRMEMVCPRSRLPEVAAALRQAHPYEEPAFDVVPLLTPPAASEAGEGQGRVVELAQPLTVAAAVRRVKRHLGVKHLEVAAADLQATVRRVGLCAGAGGSLLPEAGAVDLFLTGEMRHHDVLDARARGTAVLLAGHTQTERPYLPTYRARLAERAGAGVGWLVSEADQPPSAVM